MLRLLAAAAIAVLGVSGHAVAQDYPNKPIRLIVGFPPGAGTDATARVAAEYLSQRLGQSVVVENKGGAGTAIAADFIAKSKNDGYTLFWGTSDSFAILPAVFRLIVQCPITLSPRTAVTFDMPPPSRSAPGSCDRCASAMCR